MHKPGIFIQTVHKPGIIIHITLNGIMFIKYILFTNKYKYGLDATNKYLMYINRIIHISHPNSLVNPLKQYKCDTP